MKLPIPEQLTPPASTIRAGGRFLKQEIGMYPVLFYIDPVPIWSYGTFIARGMMTLFAMALIAARQDGRSWEQLLPVAMGGMFVAACLVTFMTILSFPDIGDRTGWVFIVVMAVGLVVLGGIAIYVFERWRSS